MSISTKRIIVIALVVFIVLSATVLLNDYPAERTGLPNFPAMALEQDESAQEDDTEPSGNVNLQLAFSHDEHFYDYTIYVSIIASIPDAEIYYTIDGDEPSAESTRYTGPIQIETAKEDSDINALTLKAIAVYKNTVTRPLVHTYFIGTNIESRFDVLVFSLSTNSDHLYDYDTGIFVEGVTRREFIRENPKAHINPPSPANFNWRGMEGERPVYVEVFEPNGERVIAQAAGIRAHGGWSRAANQKSIRLIARNEYEPGQGKFHFDFFPNDFIQDGYETPLRKYDQLVLRNGANDRDFGMLRNEVGYELARMTSLHVVSPIRPAAIFINGEYYGFTWLQVRVNAQYLQDKFNAPTRDFQIVGMGEQWIDSEDEEEIEAIKEIHSFYNKNFNNDTVYSQFTELVDIDNLLLYYALQTYLGNHDWPNNNLKLWRYTGPQEEESAPELDGRWRYLVFDLDWILGLYEDPPNAARPTFQEMMNTRNNRFSHMLNALFKRPELVDKFAMLMCDIAANIVTKENVGNLINELYGVAQNEINHAFAAQRYAHWVSTDTVRNNHKNMLLVAEKRSDYIFQSLRDRFEWEDNMFTVEVTGSPAFIGTQIGKSSRYFDHLIIPLRPALPEYSEFVHWVVNGKIIETPDITVSVADAIGGVVKIELVTREDMPLLIFKEAYGSSERNGCVIFNPGNETVRTDGLYMTNDMENPFRWALPGAAVEPGGIIEFAGRGSRGPDDLRKIRMGFNARHGHRLYLTDETGAVIANILVG